MKVLLRAIFKTFGDLIKGLQKVMVQSILSGPKTPLRALMGTTVNSYLNTINQALGATMRLPFTNDVATYKASIAKLKGQFELIPEAYQVFQRQWNAKFNANIAITAKNMTFQKQLVRNFKANVSVVDGAIAVKEISVADFAGLGVALSSPPNNFEVSGHYDSNYFDSKLPN